MARHPLRDAADSFRQALAHDEYASVLKAGWSGPSDPARRSLPLIVLALTFTTGLVDAVSYLGLGQVFTAFQTGNLVLLGFALAGTDGFAIAPPAISLTAFVAGAAFGGWLAVHFGERHRRWLALALVTEAGLVGIAAASAAGLLPELPIDQRSLLIALLASAMGVRSATIRRLSAPGVTTTVLTSTITDLAGSSPGAGLGRRGWALATILARLLGAVVGALLIQVSLLLPILLLTCFSTVVAAAYVAPVIARARRARKRANG